MTAAPRMPLPDARPVGGPKRPAPQPDAATRPNDVLIGEDWVSAEVSTDPELIQRRGRGSITSLNRSPLARKIIIFNLMALVVMVVGVRSSISRVARRFSMRLAVVTARARLCRL